MKKSSPQKSSDFDKYSDDYSDDKYDYDEEEEDYEDDMSEYQQSKDGSQGKGRYSKDQMSRGSLRGMKQQQCTNRFKIWTCFPSDVYHQLLKITEVFQLNIERFVYCIFSRTERKGQRERTRKRARDAPEKQETERQTVGRTRAWQGRRPGNGRHGTSKYRINSYNFV